MKAILYDRFGPPEVLQYKDIEKPVPSDHEVLIRVCSTTVNAADCNLRRCGILCGPAGESLRS